VAPSASITDEVPDWKCADRVYLEHTGSSHDAVALLAGRPWPQDVCESDLAGRQDRLADGRIALLFDNVTRPRGCPSWLAVFFKGHGLSYREIPDLGGPWSYLNNDHWDDGAVTDRIPVTLNVWYLGGEGAETLLDRSKKDFDHAQAIYEEQPIGVELTGNWQAVPAVSAPTTGNCAPSTAAPDQINVYYLPPSHPFHPGSGDGAYCRTGPATDVIVIATEPARHSATALAHYLGRALGLAEQSGSTWVNNVMSSVPSDARIVLTLGQAFRLNVEPASWLNAAAKRGATAVKISCDATPDYCPGLGAVVVP
jgi:hypothetical protein